MCCPLVFEFSVGTGGSVIGLGQITFCFSMNQVNLISIQKFSLNGLKADMNSDILLRTEAIFF